MSHELFELIGMLGVGASLTALFQRAVHPLLLRFAGGPGERAAIALGGRASGANLAPERGAPRSVDAQAARR